MNEIPLQPIGRVDAVTICGVLLVYSGFISPLGDVDPSTGRLRDLGSLRNKILAVRGFTGSTVGPYVIYSLKKRGMAPRAIIVEQVDVNVLTSAVMTGIPLFKVADFSSLNEMYSRGIRLTCIEGGKLKPQGAIIAIEGLDGAGKTTVARFLLEVLRRCGYRAAYTYEPYYNTIRNIFEKREMILTPETEAMLMVADRYSHYEGVIKSELRSGGIVIIDRYKYSTIAYQGAIGLPVEWLREIQKFLPDPDVGIYLDISPEEGLKRKTEGGSRSLAYFEDLDRLRRTREIYLELASRGDLVVVDASLELRWVVSRVLEIIEQRLGLELKTCFSYSNFLKPSPSP